MNDDEALQTLSVCPGLWGRAGCKLACQTTLGAKKSRVQCVHHIYAPNGFRPVGGQKRQSLYSSLKQIGDTMGLKPDISLAAFLAAAARGAVEEHTFEGEKNSSPRPQDTKNAGADRKKRTRLKDGQTNLAGRAKLAAQLSATTGMQKSPDSQHSKEEMQLLQHARRELRQRYA